MRIDLYRQLSGYLSFFSSSATQFSPSAGNVHDAVFYTKPLKESDSLCEIGRRQITATHISVLHYTPFMAR